MPIFFGFSLFPWTPPNDPQYDRSGRSSGSAIIAFETVAEAIRAKKQFDGILAKGSLFLSLHSISLFFPQLNFFLHIFSSS